ncbi:hypothetical protein AB0368_23510 [Actinoplanes sp. NPDC051475]|uniref:hypothetical protein n=1 Tax=Actinoplanes sp. NPDC051475 TaxID=3157225 RepID=UPI00344FD94D
MNDLGEVAADIVPYVSAAAAAYGGAVVQRVTDAAADSGADASVRLGRRLLTRLFLSRRAEQVKDAVRELGEDPGDEATADLVRAQILKALSDDPELAAELAGMVQPGGGDRYTVSVTSSSGFQIGSHNTQTNTWTSRPE